MRHLEKEESIEKKQAEIISRSEWINLVNKGAQSTSKSTAYKYLEYIGEVTGYKSSLLKQEDAEFDEEYKEKTEEDYLIQVDKLNEDQAPHITIT